jgi:hypothetical protein
MDMGHLSSISQFTIQIQILCIDSWVERRSKHTSNAQRTLPEGQ